MWPVSSLESPTYHSWWPPKFQDHSTSSSSTFCWQGSYSMHNAIHQVSDCAHLIEIIYSCCTNDMCMHEHNSSIQSCMCVWKSIEVTLLVNKLIIVGIKNYSRWDDCIHEKILLWYLLKTKLPCIVCVYVTHHVVRQIMITSVHMISRCTVNFGMAGKMTNGTNGKHTMANVSTWVYQNLWQRANGVGHDHCTKP